MTDPQIRTATITTQDLASALKIEFGFLMFGSQREYDKQTWIDIANTILDTIDPMGETDPQSPYFNGCKCDYCAGRDY
jgi:hypothetical protein